MERHKYNKSEVNLLIPLHRFTACKKDSSGEPAARYVSLWEWIIHLYFANNFPIIVHLTLPEEKYTPKDQWLREGQVCSGVQGSNIMDFPDWGG